MSKVKEYVEIRGKRVALSVQNLIEAYEKIEKLEKELELLDQRNYDIATKAGKLLLNLT